jgi:hypothetical protein
MMKLNLLAEDVLFETIEKIGPKKWRVLSKKKHKGKKKNLGTYSSREKAVKRLGQVEYFKHKG